MGKITRIIISGSSGFCTVDQAYTDKITVTEGSLAYEYKPMHETLVHPSRKWSYKSNNLAFQNMYDELVNEMPFIINYDKELFCTDVGGIEFIITYSDKTKFKKMFFLSGDEFEQCFQIIKRVVPGCEAVPRVLMTESD